MVTPAFSSLDNPYIVGKPLRGGLEGRDDVLAYIQQTFEARHGQVVLLYGQRRIGKTSILFSLEKKLDLTIYQPIYVDMQDSAGLPFNETLYKLASYVNKVTLRLKPAQLREGLNGEEIEPEDYFKELFLPKAFNALGERRLVLLLDEVDTLDPFYNKNLDRPEESTAWRIFQFFRSLLREHPRLSLVVVMGRSPASLSEAARNALIDSSALRVTYLDRAYAENLIRLAERQGMVKYDPASIPAILTLTNGHPYFTQLLCSEIYIRCYQEGSAALGPCPTVTPEIVEGALQEVFRQGRQVLENVWDSFDLREQLVMAMVAELTDQPDQPLTKSEILEGFNQKRIPFTLETLADIPDHLMDQGYFQRDTNRTDLNYCFRADLLRRWVRTEKPLDKVRQEIDRLDPVADSFFQQARQAELAGNTEEAVDDYKQAIERNPEHIRARLGLGQLYLRQAQGDSPVNVPKLEAGMEVFRDAYRRTPALVKADLGHTLRLLAENASNEEAAFHYYEEMLSLFPGDTLAVERIEQLGTKLEQAGRLEQAREYFLKLGNQARVQLLDEKIQRSSRIAALLLQVTEVTRPGGEFWDQAVPLYQELVELQPEFPAWNLHLANARKQMRLAELYTGAQVAYKAGRYAIAVAALHEITQTQPDYRNTPTFLKKAERQLERQQRLQDLRSGSLRGYVGRLAPLFLMIALVALVVLAADLILRNGSTSNPTPTSVAVVTTAGSSTTQAASTTAAITGTSSSSLPAVTTSSVVRPSVTGGNTTAAISTTVVPATTAPTTIVVPTTAPPAQAQFGPVQDLAYNTGTNEVAAATQTDDIDIIDFSTGKIKTSFKPDLSGDTKSAQLQLAYSPDGKSLALGLGNGKVGIYSTDGKTQLKSVDVAGGEIEGIAYSPDGKYLAVAASLKLVLLDTTNFSSKDLPVVAQFTAVAFAPDSQSLAAATKPANGSPAIQIYTLTDLANGKATKTLAGPNDTITSLAYSPNNKYLAAGSKDRTISVYNPTDYSKLFTLTGHNGPVNAVRFAPDSDTLASGSDDKTVKLWALSGQNLRATFVNHTDAVTSVCFTSDGNKIISASLDATVRVWDATSGKPVALNGTFTSPDSSAVLRALAVTQDGKNLALGRQDGTVQTVNRADFSPLHSYNTASKQPVTDLAFSPTGDFLVGGSANKLNLWNLKNDQFNFVIGPAAITGLSFSPDGKTVAASAASDDNSGYVALYDLGSQFEVVGSRNQYDSPAYAVSYSPDGKLLALAMGNGKVRLFQTSPFREQTDKTIDVSQGKNYSVVFSPDSKFLAVGTSTGAIRLVNLTNGDAKTLRDTTNNEVRALAFSSDSTSLATGSIASQASNSTVHLWDVASGQELANFSGVAQGAYSLTFIPQEKTLAVAVYNDPTGAGQQKSLKFINVDNSSQATYPK